MIRVLNLCPGLSEGGISSVILNYYKNIDKSKVHFDFAIFHKTIGTSGKIFQEMGSKIYILPTKTESLIKYYKTLKKIIKDGNYDVVHAHENYMGFISLFIAKLCGVKTRIIHSHTANQIMPGKKEKFLAFIGRPLTKLMATDYVACGKDACIYMYGNKYLDSGKAIILPNAIDITKYTFNSELRKELREKYNFQNKFVVGTMARLSSIKNINFYIDCMKDLVQTNDNIIFAIFGAGDKFDDLKNQIESNNLQENVFLMGSVSEAEKYYNIFDMVVMPSIKEGFPMVGVESIANGLPIIFSDTITKDFMIYKGAYYLPLEKNLWVNKTLEIMHENNNIRQKNNMAIDDAVRYDNIKELKNNNLDINEAYLKLQDLYCKE